MQLSHPHRARREEYQQHERAGSREEKLNALQTFIDELLRDAQYDWRPWALSVARKVIDDGDETVIRMPLFKRVIFPSLFEALDAKAPGAARWLAGLSQLLYQCHSCLRRLGDLRSTEVALLRLALEHDPSDQRARNRLIHAVADRFQFCLHELPAGVLYGMNGATPTECDELLAELVEFRELLAAAGRTREYAQLVAECAFHFDAYRRFLACDARNGGYAAYLARQRDRAF
jgi:hypothetical protein